jgi:hypothetical protein
MKKLALLRFGNSPSREVSAALAPHIVGKGFAAPVPGAILSVFNTNSSIEEVSSGVASTGATFVLTEFIPGQSVCLPPELMLMIDGITGEAERPEPKTQWTLDELLDIINQGGIESLTPEQKIQLAGYSR